MKRCEPQLESGTNTENRFNKESEHARSFQRKSDFFLGEFAVNISSAMIPTR